MGSKALRLCVNAIVALLALAFVIERMYLAFAATVIAGMALSALISRATYSRSWEPEVDERDLVIEAMAARALVKALFLGGGLAIIVYTALRSVGAISPPQWLDRDMTLVAYAICALLLLWLPLYAYYRWKLGG